MPTSNSKKYICSATFSVETYVHIMHAPSKQQGGKYGGDNHGLINYKDTKTKGRRYLYLIEFVDWRYSQSCWLLYHPNKTKEGRGTQTDKPAAKKSLLQVNFLDNDIWHCFLSV